MSYVSNHLSSLRREIIDLQSRNYRYSQKSEHSATEQSDFEMRAVRLLQIEYELSKMLNSSETYAVWWDKPHKTDRAA